MKKLLSLTLAALFILSLLPGALAEEPITLRVSGLRYFDEAIVNQYAAETGVRFEELDEGSVMDNLSNAFATRDDKTDLFSYSAHAGLFAVKEHDYYAPLEDNPDIAAKLDDLYPAFRSVLTDDGHIAGWVLYAQPLTFHANADLLAENGLSVPNTFAELLDVCKALTDLDVIDQRTALFTMQSYTAGGMLDLYMAEYIRACALNGGIVDFTKPEFAAMAERIRSEVPATAPEIDWEELMHEVFTYPSATEYIEAGMVPFPAVLEGQSGAVETFMNVATVNPNAANRDAAIAFLGYYAAHNKAGYSFDASLTEPLRSEYHVGQLQEIAVQLKVLEAIAEPTPEQQDQIADLKASRAIHEEWQWAVSEEAIASYRDFARNLVVNEASPIEYDAALRTIAERFLNGAYDGAGFAKACQEHIAMIYQEHGIPME